MNDLINFVEKQTARDITDYDFFKSGDTVAVSYKIIEGSKERIQIFRGDVIQIKGTGSTKTFTVRKMSSGIGVERIFPFSTPNLMEVKVLKKGKVRRAKLYYLRDLKGKKAKIKERTAK